MHASRKAELRHSRKAELRHKTARTGQQIVDAYLDPTTTNIQSSPPTTTATNKKSCPIPRGKPKSNAAAYGKRMIMRVLTRDDDDMGLRRPRNSSGAHQSFKAPPKVPNLVTKSLSDPTKTATMLKKNWNHKLFHAKEVSPALNRRKPRASEPKDLYNYLMNHTEFRFNKKRTGLRGIQRGGTTTF